MEIPEYPDFHPAAMTVEVVPFFARLAHASLEAIRGWEVGSRCNLHSMAPLPFVSVSRK